MPKPSKPWGCRTDEDIPTRGPLGFHLPLIGVPSARGEPEVGADWHRRERWEPQDLVSAERVGCRRSPSPLSSPSVPPPTPPSPARTGRSRLGGSSNGPTRTSSRSTL